MQIQPIEQSDQPLNKAVSTRALPKLSSVVGLLAFLLPWVLLKGCSGSQEFSGAELIVPQQVGNVTISFVGYAIMIALPSIIGLAVLLFVFRLRDLAQHENVERLTMLLALVAVLPALDVILSLTASPNISNYAELRGGVYLSALGYLAVFIFALINLRLIHNRLTALPNAAHGQRQLSGLVKVAAGWNITLAVMLGITALTGAASSQVSQLVNYSEASFRNINLAIAVLVLLGTLAALKLWRVNAPISVPLSAPVLPAPEVGEPILPMPAPEPIVLQNPVRVGPTPLQQTPHAPEPHPAESVGYVLPTPAQKTEILNAPPPMPIKGWLVARDGAQVGRKFNITEEGARIGRASDNDIALGDDAVGRHHARIKLSDGAFELFDLASTNGVFKKTPAGEWARIYREFITDGDQIRIGETTFSFYEMPK